MKPNLISGSARQSADTELGPAAGFHLMFEAERNWHSGFGPNSSGQAVHVADRLSYDGRRKVAILIALLDPRAPETGGGAARWRGAERSAGRRR
jgi:hypothetical protein